MEDRTFKQKMNTLQGKVETMLSLGCHQIETYETLKDTLDDHIKAIFPELLEVQNDPQS